MRKGARTIGCASTPVEVGYQAVVNVGHSRVLEANNKAYKGRDLDWSGACLGEPLSTALDGGFDKLLNVRTHGFGRGTRDPEEHRPRQEPESGFGTKCSSWYWGVCIGRGIRPEVHALAHVGDAYSIPW
ncbi:hypothetical protein KCU61_g433, partial [Aureobasidium melanogenum]